MPRWVLDYVLLHELNHLLHAGHGPDFWAELEGYPRTQRARGFLEGYAFAGEPAAGRGGDGGAPDDQTGTTGADVVDAFEDDVAGEVDDLTDGLDVRGTTAADLMADVVEQVDAGR
jgi:hypothetical protein